MENTSKKMKNKLAKTLFAAALMVGAAAIVFQGFTQIAMAAENNKVTILPTVYPTTVNLPVAPKQAELPEGYVKPNYTVADNSLEYYQNNKPTANDISRDEAAEIGVQALWSVYGLDLNGKTVEMGYEPARDVLRAKWTGNFWCDGQSGPDHPLYTFSIDAVTGEVYSVIYGRILDEKVNVGYDSELAKNPTAMEAAAKKYAEDLNVTGGPVKSSTIASQGYSVNDPTVSFRIVGENGQLAIIGMSRYDEALLSVSYNGYVVEQDAWVAQLERNLAEIDKDAVPM